MKKNLLFVCIFLLAFFYDVRGQNKVTGRVTEEAGSPLPGVNVVVKGTTSGTVTDSNGNFTIEVPGSEGVLIFSFIGFITQEVGVGGRNSVDVQMQPDVRELSELIVTAVGVERSEKSLGYAATQVSSNDLTQGRAINPMSSLQGKIAGVNISTASGAPGASTKVIIRGFSSIGGNNNPLYVVDGVPINNSSNSNFADPTNLDVDRTQDYGNRANDINPDDIETVTVLKGASATALYGSRAANGVIMITTKKGNEGGVKIDLSSSATFSEPLRVPQFQNVFGQGWSGHFAYDENGSWGPKMDGKDRLWGNVVNNAQQLKQFSPLKDNLRDFYETGKSLINSIGVSGGNNNSTFYLSYGNVQEDGIIPTDADSYKRNTISFRGSTKGKRISSSASLNYVNKKSRVVTTGQGGDGATVFQEIIQIPRDISILELKDFNNEFNNLDNYFTQYAQNPWFALNKNGNNYREDRVYGNVAINYNFTDWLTATVRLGGDISNAHVRDWIAIAETSPTSPNRSVTQVRGRVDEWRRFASELNGDFILNASNSISEKIKITSLVGFNINDRQTNNLHSYVNDLGIDGFYNLSNSSNPPASSTLLSHRRLFGLYGQSEIGFNEYLFLTLLARNDWSSTLPAGKNSFFYPGANLSFVFTEAFDVHGPLSFGKLRASIGQTGNDADPYDIYSVAIPGDVQLGFGNILFPLNGVNAYEVSNQLGNATLEPEITTEFEIGADLRFFDSRVNLDATYYNGVTEGQILSVDIPYSSGYSVQTVNVGRVRNSGIELLLSVNPVRTDNFQWHVTGNYSRNVSEVEELTSGLDKVLLNTVYDMDFVAKVGKPLGMIQGYGILRDDQGRVVVNAADGFPRFTPLKEDFGTTAPDFTLGVTNSFSYKNLSLSVLFDMRKGGVMYSFTKHLNYFVGNATATLYNDRQPFIIPNSVVESGDDNGQGDPVYVENTRPLTMNEINAYWYHAQNPSRVRDFIVDKSYVKLREVVLSYNFPSSILSKTPLSSLSLSLVGRNLLLWTPESNNIMDPESTTFGNDLMSEFGEFAVGPTVRNMGFSLKATF